ncbi:rhomboid family intramembrane serine protease [Mangrovibacterium marinum]|uniref:Rhomboid family protein n=1 Tax=Mangrovibacterium marinum TaxID=1639118 RepID=A0A2T5BZW7_9BACT|nr:rhomboid family intramembrane serine protease [Mangrovibacterium marinum]PTN07849.1 rhomboid family protein [Mangrovibacterium marinum]
MTTILIVITCLISIAAFGKPALLDKLQFNASKIVHQHQYYRLVTHGFVHANWEHLIVNMIVLYSFGRAIEQYFFVFGRMANAYFLLLYFGGMLVSNIYALYKHRNNFYYNAVGASGAVSAVLFAAIFFDPWNKIYFFGILPIPGIVFALLYLAYSYYMSRKQNDNIAHDAHFLGALFGFIYPILLNANYFQHFVDRLFGVI